MKRLSIIGLILVLSSMVFAAGSEHHSGGIPQIVLWQFINFSLLCGLLYYLLKKPAKAFFAERENAYREVIDKVQLIKKQAEEEHLILREQLQNLESKSEENIKKVQMETEELKKRIIEEAKQLSQELFEETQKTIRFETEKAIHDLKNKVIEESINAAKKVINKDLNEDKHKSLQKTFLDKF